jgi:enamine deaminase RidA (YjgF/YER057c/UK114 family)
MRRIRLAGQLAEPISHYSDGFEADGFLYVSGMSDAVTCCSAGAPDNP